MFRKDLKNRDLIIAISTSLIIVTVLWKLMGYFPEVLNFLGKLYGLLVPFLYAFVIAYVLNPIVKLFSNKFKINKSISILLSYLVFFGAMALLAFVAIPNIYESISEIVAQLPQYIKEAQAFFYKLMEKQNIKELIEASGMTNNINQMISQVGEVSIKLLEGTFGKVFSITTSVVNIGLGLIISIYVLVDLDRFKKEGKRFLLVTIKKEKTEYILEIFRTFHNMIGSYIGIKAIDSSIIGLLAFVLLKLVGSEYATFLSIIVAITNMIPYFGPFIGEVVGFLFNVFVSPVKALIVFGVLFALQMFDGWYLDPKLVGNKVGVRPFFIILAVLIGGGFFGAVGMLLGSPAVATIKIYYDRFIQTREKRILDSELNKKELD